MRKKTLRILLPVFFALLFSACPGKEDSSGDSSIFSLDQTQEAIDTINEANGELRKIKQLFKENEERQEDLKAAMTNKETAKVKEIAGELVTQISEGMLIGEKAIEKIEKAQNMNVNSDFKNYLALKVESLRKYTEAYEQRKKLADLLSRSYDPKDSKALANFLQEYKKSDETFKRIIEEAQEVSEKANELAAEANSQNREK